MFESHSSTLRGLSIAGDLLWLILVELELELCDGVDMKVGDDVLRYLLRQFFPKFIPNRRTNTDKERSV